MHYKNGRPAKVGDWVIGKTHNSNGQVLVGYVTELMPDGGVCNVKLRLPTFDGIDYMGGVMVTGEIRLRSCEVDYAYTANLIHTMDGYRLASIAAEAWKWDSEANPYAATP